MYFVVRELLQPFPLICLALALAVWRLGRSPAVPTRAIWVARGALTLLYLATNPYIAAGLVRSLERQHAPATLSATSVPEAIVVLSGGFRRGVDGRGALAEDTNVRCLHGFEWYRALGRRPIVVTGGVLSTGPSNVAVAEAMRDLFVRIGVPPDDVLVEPRAETTFENARETRRLLEARGVDRILLVTDAMHMSRSVAVFEKQGFDVVPAPCNFLAPGFTWSPRFFIPSTRSGEQINHAVHEWGGLFWYWLHGRI